MLKSLTVHFKWGQKTQVWPANTLDYIRNMLLLLAPLSSAAHWTHHRTHKITHKREQYDTLPYYDSKSSLTHCSPLIWRQSGRIWSSHQLLIWTGAFLIVAAMLDGSAKKQNATFRDVRRFHTRGQTTGEGDVKWSCFRFRVVRQDVLHLRQKSGRPRQQIATLIHSES